MAGVTSAASEVEAGVAAGRRASNLIQCGPGGFTSMKRRDFVRVVGGVVVAGAAAGAVAGCGGDDGGGSPDGGGDDNCATQISANHGHAVTVSPDDVAAGVDKTYSIQGSSTHDHMITLTAAQFGMLAGGTAV